MNPLLQLLQSACLLMIRRSGAWPRAALGLGAGAALSSVLVALAAGALVVRTGALQDGVRAVVVEVGRDLREGPDTRAKTRARLTMVFLLATTKALR